ncbi:MAG: hypothetical protein WC494_00155 [Candidatus Pacearchaeota archaeon]
MVSILGLFQGVNLFNRDYGLAFVMVFFTTVFVIYSIFVYYFYRFLAKKNLFELNLSQYNQYSSPGIVKFFAVLFYFLEYILFLPIMVLFWFGVLAILILMMAEGVETPTILLISAALVASVRITSYVSENLSKDLAKVFPFTIIAVAITQKGFFNVSSFLSRIGEIPSLFSNILYYLVFIVAIELLMRVAESVTILFKQTNE